MTIDSNVPVEAGRTIPMSEAGPARSVGPTALLGRLRPTRYSGVLLWIAIIAFFAIRLPDTFPTQATATSIAGDQSITLVLALGMLATLAVGQFDLSAAQNLGMSAILSAVLMVNHHMNPALAVLITMLVGLVIGLLNALFVAVIGIDSLVATLGMSSVLLALTGLLSNYQFIGPVPDGFQSLANHEVAGFPVVALYAGALAVLAWYLFEHTPIGRRAFAVGANPDASRLAGVRTTRYIAGSFVVTSLAAALAGVLTTAKIGNVAPSLGPAYLLPSFAACFLGTTQFLPGRFNVAGTVLALVLLATGVKGLQLMGGPLWVTDMFNGIALLLAVAAAVLSTKRRPRIRGGRARVREEVVAE